MCRLFALILITLCGDFAYSQTFVGYVAEISGNWQVNGRGFTAGTKTACFSNDQHCTQRGRKLYQGFGSQRQNTHLQKMLTALFIQSAGGTCPDFIFRRNYSTIMDLVWSSSSESNSRHRSKGRNFPDGIVKLENEKINLTQPAGIPKKISLMWREIKSIEKNEFGEWSKEIDIKTGNKQFIIPFSGFQPGLYEFCTLINSKTSSKSETGSCPTMTTWFFVSSPEKYEQIKKEFDETKKAVFELTETRIETVDGKENEIPGIDSETARLYIQVFLYSLARKNRM